MVRISSGALGTIFKYSVTANWGFRLLILEDACGSRVRQPEYRLNLRCPFRALNTEFTHSYYCRGCSYTAHVP